MQEHHWLERKDDVVAEIRSIGDPRKYPDRSRPRPVQFAWQPPDPNQNHAQYDLLIARSPTFEDVQVIPGLGGSPAEVPNLLLGERYYWKVIQRRDGMPTAKSPAWSFRTHTAPPRWIRVPGISNVRDVGGWPIDAASRVRQDLLFRSSELNTHIMVSAEGARVLVEDLGIRTDLDLRGTADDENPAPALDTASVTWEHCPLYAYKDIFTPTGMASIRRAFRVLADPARYPLLFHCWGGADRAGTLSFLVNGLLGVGLDDLIHDYELTSLSIMGLRLHTDGGFQEILAGLRDFGAEEATIQARIEAYLLAAGVTAEEMQRMRELLMRRLNNIKTRAVRPSFLCYSMVMSGQWEKTRILGVCGGEAPQTPKIQQPSPIAEQLHSMYIKKTSAGSG